MRTQEYTPTRKFEQTILEKNISTERMGGICLALADMCIQYAGIERVPRYNEQHRENDAEHSLMVGVVAIELASELRPDLDKGLLAQYAMVHDFPEIKAGDTPTYHLSDQELLDKSAREQSALEELINTLPPYLRSILMEYEEQLTPESRFIRAVDKLMPLLVDILGPGKKVMKEDYGVTTVAQLLQNKQRLDESMVRRFGEDAPEIVEIYHHLGVVFTEAFITSNL